MNDNYFNSEMNKIRNMQAQIGAKGKYIEDHSTDDDMVNPIRWKKMSTDIDKIAEHGIEKLQQLTAKKPTNHQLLQIQSQLQSLLDLRIKSQQLWDIMIEKS